MLRRMLLALSAALLLPFLTANALAQTGQNQPEAPAPPPVPFGIINIASVDRLFNDTEFMFKSINRPDVFAFVKQIVAANANDLKGVDRTKPLGVMFFLEAGLPPKPQPVLYMPVTKPDEFIQTAALGRMKFEKVPGAAEKYEVKVPRGPKQNALFANGMLFLTPSEVLLDEQIPDPVKLNETLTSRYDIALSLRVNSVPALIRDVFVTYLRTSTEAEMQRRDEESEAEWRMRKANAVSMMGAVEELLTQTDEITIGWDGNEELHKGVLDLNVQAAPASDYAKSLLDLAGRPSYFHIAQEDTGKPLTGSISWKMSKREKTAAAEMVEAARVAMTNGLLEQKKDVTGANTICDVLAATVGLGHLDGFVQVSVPEPGKFIVLGGVKVQGADAAATAIANVIQQIPEDKLNDVKIETNVDSHQGVPFNRFSPKKDDSVKFFGGVPAFWLGSGQQALWFAFGSEKTFDTLRDTMDRVLTSGPAPGGQSDPFVIIVRRAAWQSLMPDEKNRFEKVRHQIAEEAFTSSNDAFKVYTRPTENGVRTRLEFEEGFIKMFALFLARQYDSSQL